jgi:hypothetical protein
LSPRLFFTLLAGILTASALVVLVHFFSPHGETPSGPCVSSIENGDFVSNAFEHYRFNGSVTFWPEAQSITAFGFVVTDGRKMQLRRQMRLKKLGKRDGRPIFSVLSLDIDATDQLHGHEIFFSEPGQKFYMSIKRVSANEYIYFINDNWLFMCRVR